MPSAVAVGPEFPSAQTPGTLSSARIAMVPDGRYVVAWESAHGDGSGYGVFARVFDWDSTPLTGDLLVNTTTAGDQRHPDVAVDAAGNFVVTWQSPDGSGNGIFAQLFDASGTKLGTEFRATADIWYEQNSPSVAMAPDGRFVIGWTWSIPSYDWAVFARRFAADGTPLDAQ